MSAGARRGDALAAAAAMVAIGWGANQFAPLVVMYQEVAGVGETAAQTMFVLYAVGLVPGLFLGGPLSDRFGRRVVVLVALAASLAATSLLVAGAVGAGWLYAGRLLAGLASGAGFSAGTAWVKEASPAGRGPRTAVIAMTAGFGLGPLVAGLVAASAEHPQVVTYLPHLAITLLALGLVLSRPRTPPVNTLETPVASALDPGMWTLPQARRVIVPLAPWVFLTASVALAVLPGAASGPGAERDLTFAALITSIPALAGISAQSFARHLRGLRDEIVGGLALATLGLAVGAWAIAATSLATAFVAAIILGFSYGMCQAAGLSEVARLSPPQRLGRNTAVYQSLTYLGYMAPLPITALARWVDLTTILLALAALAVVTAVAVAGHLTRAGDLTAAR